MDKALVSDIQRASVNDGYGIRTTVFFKGWLKTRGVAIPSA